MSKKAMFVWLGEPQSTRSTANRGTTRLETGKEYPVDWFGMAVVEEWVRTGFARFKDERAETKKEG